MKTQKENFTSDITVPDKRLDELNHSPAQTDFIYHLAEELLNHAIDFYNEKINKIDLKYLASKVLDKVACPSNTCDDLIKWLEIYKPSRHKLLKNKLIKVLSSLKQSLVYTESSEESDNEDNNANYRDNFPSIEVSSYDLKQVIDEIVKFTKKHSKHSDIVYVIPDRKKEFDSLTDLTAYLKDILKHDQYEVTTLFTNQLFNKKNNKFILDVNIGPTFKNPIGDTIRSFGESKKYEDSDTNNNSEKKIFSFQSKNRIITIEGLERNTAQQIAIKLMAPIKDMIHLPEGNYKLTFLDI